jgi:hypothetical protein
MIGLRFGGVAAEQGDFLAASGVALSLIPKLARNGLRAEPDLALVCWFRGFPTASLNSRAFSRMLLFSDCQNPESDLDPWEASERGFRLAECGLQLSAFRLRKVRTASSSAAAACYPTKGISISGLYKRPASQRRCRASGNIRSMAGQACPRRITTFKFVK